MKKRLTEAQIVGFVREADVSNSATEAISMLPSKTTVNRNSKKTRTKRHSIALIYGEQVVDDIDFCRRHNTLINRYSHGIMTLQGCSLGELAALSRDVSCVNGWVESMREHPGDREILQEFLARLVARYSAIGRGTGD